MKKNMITIGLFVDSFYPMVDGVVKVVDNYATRLSRYARVIVFAPLPPHTKFDDSQFGYEVVRCKSFKVPFLDYSLAIPNKKFKAMINDYNLDIVHIHSPFTIGKLGIKYAKKKNVVLIGTLHSQFKQDFKRAVKSDFIATKLNNILVKEFNKCDECWTVNDEVAKIFYEDYGGKSLPRVVRNATEMVPINNKNKSKAIINKIYNISNDTKVFLFVGRINKLKNIFFIVDSLKIVKELDPTLDFKMLFVGTGQDENSLKEYVKMNDMEDKIILCGKVYDRNMLANYYARADLFLFPSVYDASSLVQVEAATQKTPTVFIEGSATAGTVTNNVNGFITKPNPDAYARKIIEVMNNLNLYQKVSNQAYKDLYINWDTVTLEVYKLYLDMIKQKS